MQFHSVLKALSVSLALAPLAAFATATPITQDVALKSAPFNEQIYQALEKTTRPQVVNRAGGQTSRIQIGNGLLCVAQTALVSGGARNVSYQCALLKSGGWKSFGNETYGSGDNTAFTMALYDALGVPEQKDEAFSMKVIQLDRPDGNGGTERNQLGCTKPTPEGVKLGLRATCQVTNAL